MKQMFNCKPLRNTFRQSGIEREREREIGRERERARQRERKDDWRTDIIRTGNLSVDMFFCFLILYNVFLIPAFLN